MLKFLGKWLKIVFVVWFIIFALLFVVCSVLQFMSKDKIYSAQMIIQSEITPQIHQEVHHNEDIHRYYKVKLIFDSKIFRAHEFSQLTLCDVSWDTNIQGSHRVEQQSFDGGRYIEISTNHQFENGDYIGSLAYSVDFLFIPLVIESIKWLVLLMVCVSVLILLIYTPRILNKTKTYPVPPPPIA